MPDRIAPGVYRLELGWRAPLGANAYLIVEGEPADGEVGDADGAADSDVTLVDAGFPQFAGRLREGLASLGLTVGDIDRVLVTHYDLDHVGGLSRIADDLSAPVYVGEDDLAMIEGETRPPFLHHKGLFHRAVRRLFPMPAALDYRPVADGDAIGGFTAFHTPGHNLGHTVYVHEAMGVAALGDLVWEDDGALTIPIWFDSYDMWELRESVERFAERAPPFEVACTGHGEPLRSGGREALFDLVDRLEDESNWLP